MGCATIELRLISMNLLSAYFCINNPVRHHLIHQTITDDGLLFATCNPDEVGSAGLACFSKDKLTNAPDSLLEVLLNRLIIFRLFNHSLCHMDRSRSVTHQLGGMGY